MTRAQQQNLERQATDLIRAHCGESAADPDANNARARQRIEREAEEWNEDAGRELLHRQIDRAAAFSEDQRPCALSFDGEEVAPTNVDDGNDVAIAAVSRAAFALGQWAGRKDPVKMYAAHVALYLEPPNTAAAAKRLRVRDNFIRTRVREARAIVKTAAYSDQLKQRR